LLILFAEEFAIYLNYVRKLGFEEQPDYDFLRYLFSKVLITIGETDDGMFDWLLLNNGAGPFANPTVSNVDRHLPQRAAVQPAVRGSVPVSRLLEGLARPYVKVVREGRGREHWIRRSVSARRERIPGWEGDQVHRLYWSTHQLPLGLGDK
jgi:casein kinase 1